MSDKARYWVGVLYPENMLADWESKIFDLIQLPFAYCIHNLDKDSKSEHRKDHVHLIVVFPNTTTKKHALEVFDLLSAPGKKALNTIQACVSIRGSYDYLIHDTEGCRKAGKDLYDKSARVLGNNFDIGCYEQISLEDKKKLRSELSRFILDNQIVNYMHFYTLVLSDFPEEYEEIACSYSAHFERLCKGNYLAYVKPFEK